MSHYLLNIDTDSKDKLKSELQKIKNSSVFIQDADENKVEAYQNIQKIIAETFNENIDFTQLENLEKPFFYSGKNYKNISAFIITKPDQNNGMFEDLFLTQYKTQPIYNCVENYWKCAKENRPDEFIPKSVWESKYLSRILLAGLGSKEAIIGKVFTNKFDVQQEYWNLNHENLSPIKNYLLKIF